MLPSTIAIKEKTKTETVLDCFSTFPVSGLRANQSSRFVLRRIGSENVLSCLHMCLCI